MINGWTFCPVFCVKLGKKQVLLRYHNYFLVFQELLNFYIVFWQSHKTNRKILRVILLFTFVVLQFRKTTTKNFIVKGGWQRFPELFSSRSFIPRSENDRRGNIILNDFPLALEYIRKIFSTHNNDNILWKREIRWSIFHCSCLCLATCYRATFNWVSKAILKCSGFTLLYSVIGLKNSRDQLNQSDTKPIPIAI